MERPVAGLVRDLDEYKKFVASMARSPQLFVNRSDDADQAAAVIAAIFEHSHARVDVLTGNLDPAVYGNPVVISCALIFLARSPFATIRILTEAPVDLEHHPLLRSLRDDWSRIDIACVPSDLQQGYDYHFVLGDSQHLRFEPSRQSSQAFVKFAAGSEGSHLQSAFDQLHRTVKGRSHRAGVLVR
jgi:hypothetical protein